MFKISDRLPTVIPELPITFINPPEHIKSSSLKPLILFPIYLDVNLYAKEGIFVEGKGLHSEWQGNLHVTGTHIDVKASGKLDLIKGEYLFAGKTFSSNQGEITFNDKSSPKSYISLTGNCDLADVDVKATLYGPLTSPNLSLQSIPQMPTSSLLSHLLFNKNFEEISAVQALQLAQTILSFSQTNTPDFLEKIRNKFKIDRLNIVASEKDPEKISVQIGKYLMQGLLLTFSQGPESRNVSLELQMKHGFNLQAELGEHQGKFSFKLRHHY